MSDEHTQAVRENTDAILKLVDVTTRLADLRADAIETVKKAAAPATKTTTKKEEAPKVEETKVEETKVEETKVEETKAAAPTGPLPDKITEYVTGFDQTHAQAAEERAARSAKVKAIYAALTEKAGYQVNTQADIKPEHHPVVIKKLGELIAAGNLVIKADAPAEIEL